MSEDAIPEQRPRTEKLRQAGFSPLFAAPYGIHTDLAAAERRLAAVMDRLASKEAADMHIATAAKELGVPPERVTPAMRWFGKTINFARHYGMTGEGIEALFKKHETQR